MGTVFRQAFKIKYTSIRWKKLWFIYHTNTVHIYLYYFMVHGSWLINGSCFIFMNVIQWAKILEVTREKTRFFFKTYKLLF
jgi:hypothetical protein